MKMALKQTGTKPKTRSQTHHYVFGNYDTLPTSQLPTEINVIRFYRLLKFEKPREAQTKVFDTIIASLNKIWDSIPTIDDKAIKKKLTRLFNEDASYLSIDRQKSRYENDPNKIKEK